MSTVASLLQGLEQLGVSATGVSDDSRQVQPGDVFLAYPGGLADGRRYIANACQRGAAAVIWQPGGDFTFPADIALPQFSAEGLRPLAGPLAHELYGRPSENLALIAITGTNGKTTISQWIAAAHPQPCASIGTLGAGFSHDLEPTGFTTPEATTLMRYLRQFLDQGARACALEASSIGIEEGRMNGARVDTAIFTNFTRDHLDYHGTMEAYAAAKEKLFAWPRLRLAIVNLDDPLGQKMARETVAARTLGYTLSPDPQPMAAVIRAEKLAPTPYGQEFIFAGPTGKARVETHLVGRYNIANLLAVGAVLVDQGLKAADIAEKLSQLQPPPGRMERYGKPGEPLVVVDYSHTPDALENALVALKEVAAHRQGKLICLFGCGGDRDKGKRPLMGEVATRLADRVWVSNDNPRSEAPEAIIADILPGAPGAQVVPDRAQAVLQAVAEAGCQDVILLAGKGHETYQEIAGVKHPYSDNDQARAALLARRAQEQAP